MKPLVSASAWPVFDQYTVLGPKRHPFVCPAEGAAIRDYLDFTLPAVRQEALKATMKLTRNRGRLADDFLAYAHHFGLLGIGPSRIIHAVQFPENSRVPALAYRLGGNILGRGMMRCEGITEASLELEKLWQTEESWEYLRPGTSQAEAFAHRIGSEDWWRTYAEPVETVRDSLIALAAFDVSLLRDENWEVRHFEAALADTVVRLPQIKGRACPRDEIEFRSVSAYGALAMAVTEGVLRGWCVCADERCREVFEPSRKGQRFHDPNCQRRKYNRDHYKPMKGGGTDG